MWLVLNDICGLFCAIITYFVVVFVYLGFVRVGIWERMLEGDLRALVHFVVFQYHCFMIFWAHWKCMTTEPGVLPKLTCTLQYERLPEHLKKIVEQVGLRTKKLEALIRLEAKAKTANANSGVDIID